MDYDGLLETVFDRLNELEAAGSATPGESVTEVELAAAEARMGIRLPAELRAFYQEIGNGFVLFWESDSDHSKPWGSLQVPSLSDLVEMYHGWRGLVLYTPERAEAYGFPGTTDPALAKRTAARMWHWLPLIAEPNGDAICLDLGAPECPVVFDRHDWYDGGTGENGHVLAPNWRAFLLGWAGVCFQPPRGMYWPRCFRPDGGVAWESEEFRSPYRVRGLVETTFREQP